MGQFKNAVIPAIAASALLAACGSSSSGGSTSTGEGAAATQGSSSAAVVKAASNSSVGGTILVDARGMTLYRLAGEQNGKFICTSSACLAVWHPLTASGTPSGAIALGTVKRPDGTAQVAYHGMPLYTFAQDTAAGETKGQGIKDVGTWSVVTVAPTGASTTATPASSGAPAGGGKSYGY